MEQEVRMQAEAASGHHPVAAPLGLPSAIRTAPIRQVARRGLASQVPLSLAQQG